MNQRMRGAWHRHKLYKLRGRRMYANAQVAAARGGDGNSFKAMFLLRICTCEDEV